MTSPVKGNFGHIRESGVLLLTEEDSDIKHKRNLVITGASFFTLFTLGLGTLALKYEAKRERQIRHINKDVYPKLPYHACVLLRNHEAVIYNGVRYENPFHADDMRKLEKRLYDEAHPEEVQARQDRWNRKVESEKCGSDWL